MPILKVTITEEIEVPEGYEVLTAPITGIATGIRLPSGKFVKPWINWELFSDSDGEGDSEGDIYENELNELGIFTGLDMTRNIEVVDEEAGADVDIAVDAPAAKTE